VSTISSSSTRITTPSPFTLSSVSFGAVTALHHLATELNLASRINAAIIPAHVQTRDGLTVGESVVAAILARVCAPRSKRAFLHWAKSTYLPDLMHFCAAAPSSQHFWDQMHALPIEALPVIEQDLISEVVRREALQIQALAYDTTNFHTHIASTNAKPQLPQRGHNKQGRHDLRQLGLALIVDRSSQLPLAHSLYAGVRSDMRTFAEFLPSIRQRLRALTGQPEQLTLVFDAGASSRQNLKGLAGYVTALPPSRHAALLSEAADQLTEVALSTGAVVKAWRTRRLIAGEQREILVTYRPKPHAGQVRGLGQTMARATAEIQEFDADCARPSLEAGRKRMKKICARQYLRKPFEYELTAGEAGGGSRLRVWCNWEEYRRLDRRYFGLRLLISDRAEWGTGEIVAAYRGQSRVEAAFRDLKNPGMLAVRPQFRWTDQKLRVHAFICVVAYLLVMLLHRRARQRAAFVGEAQDLLTELAAIRCCRMIDQTGKRGRPRVRWQVEETEPERLALAEALNALPKVN
jgi:transposase